MAVAINDECTARGDCLDVCPNGAIAEGEKYEGTDECNERLACIDTSPAAATVRA